MRKLTNQEIVDRQMSFHERSRLPFSVVLNDVRSLYNVGSIFRTCDGAGVEKLWLCGITGYPPNPQITKTALGAEDCVSWEYRVDLLPVLEALKNSGYQIILLEQMDRSANFRRFRPKSPFCLIVGNEISGISQEAADFCDAAVEIEMAGSKNSLNVAVAFGIVAYQLRYQITNN